MGGWNILVGGIGGIYEWWFRRYWDQVCGDGERRVEMVEGNVG